MSKPIFINHEIVFNPTGNEFDECRGELLGSYQLVKIKDYEYKFIKQPQLTIPKSIAEMADKLINGFLKGYLPEADIPWLLENITLFLNDEDTNDFLVWEDETENSQALILTYLSSKALGVDLVKVVADD